MRFWSKPIRRALAAEGMVSEPELELLFQLASAVREGCIVEIGSYRGRSTIALALGAQAGGAGAPVYAVEPHESFTGVWGGSFGPADRAAFFRNLLRAGVAETVRLVNLPAPQVSRSWDRPIALLWIDGDHRYEAVKSDFDGWEVFVPAGGIVALHDSLDPQQGPIRVVQEALTSPRWKMERQLEITTVLKKR